jgi:hypothetical protein
MESDPILDSLAQLPALSPPPALDQKVREQASTLLEEAPLTLPQLLLYRGLAPVFLSGITAAYLFWAVTVASRLY